MTKFCLCYAGLFGMIMGCSSSIVRKPEVNTIEKVAILSIYGNADVYPAEQAPDLKEKIASHAYNTFAEEIKKLGWRVLSPRKILKSKEYEAAFKPAEADRELAQFIAPKTMWPIRFSDSVQESLSAVMKKYKLDAVVLIELRYCHENALTAESAIQMINKDGIKIVDMPKIEGCGAHRVESEPLPKEQDNSKQLLKIFKDVNEKTAAKTIARIREAKGS